MLEQDFSAGGVIGRMGGSQQHSNLGSAGAGMPPRVAKPMLAVSVYVYVYVYVYVCGCMCMCMCGCECVYVCVTMWAARVQACPLVWQNPCWR